MERMNNGTIEAVDTFCGAGGLTHGFERAGIPVSTAVDSNPDVEHAIRQNTSARFVQADLAELVDEPGRLNQMWSEGCEYRILAGGPPCQPHSRFSNKLPEEHDKHHLVRTFARIAEITEPDLVVMENVPGIERNQIYEELVGRLERAGFHASRYVMDCSGYGVPQTRRRLVTFASRRGTVLEPEPTHQTPLTVRETIGQLPPLEVGETHPDDPLHRCAGMGDTNLKRIRASEPGGTWRDWPDELKLACHKKDSGSSYPSVYGRMQWEQPAPTITTQFYNYGTGRFGHPSQDRAISLREGAMLQTFPDSFSFAPSGESFSLDAVATMIGNAVPPRLAEVVGRKLIEHVEHGQRQAGIQEYC